MMGTQSSRRGFLQALAGVAIGGPLAARFGAVAESFAATLDQVTLEPTELRSVRALRERYLLDPDILYLNHASIGTAPRAVHEAHVTYAALCETNPWLYMWGGAWEEAREEARAAVATLMAAPADRVALTHNTTEGFNLLAAGLPLGPGDEVLFSSLNHDGARVCWEHQATTRGFTVRRFEFPVERAAEVTGDEVVDIYGRSIRRSTRVLVFPHVDNTVGVRHPIGPLVDRARALGVRWVAVDGAQTLGMLPLDLPATGVDAYASSPHKWVQSPKGLGALYLTPAIQAVLRPMWVTWGQRRWAGTVRMFEDYGTRNLPELLALTDAVKFQRAIGADAKIARYRALHRTLRERVEATPGLVWHSPQRFDDGASLVAIEVVGREAPSLAAELLASDGLVVRAFQTSKLNALRLSPNVVTLDEEVERALDLLTGAAS